MKKVCGFSYPLSAQRRLWSDWAMPRLIWVYTRRTHNLLVLSWHGSIFFTIIYKFIFEATILKIIIFVNYNNNNYERTISISSYILHFGGKMCITEFVSISWVYTLQIKNPTNNVIREEKRIKIWLNKVLKEGTFSLIPLNKLVFPCTRPSPKQ